jgi:hypothetical protein
LNLFPIQRKKSVGFAREIFEIFSIFLRGRHYLVYQYSSRKVEISTIDYSPHDSRIIYERVQEGIEKSLKLQ